MKPLLSSLLASLGLITLLAGCGSPNVSTTGLGIRLVTIEQASDGSAVATLRITNPNVVSYNFSKSNHRVFVDGRQVGTIAINRATGVPARSSAATQQGVFVAKDGPLPEGALNYRLESQIVLTLWGDKREDFRLQSSGTAQVIRK